jgi:hypothetical protein
LPSRRPPAQPQPLQATQNVAPRFAGQTGWVERQPARQQQDQAKADADFRFVKNHLFISLFHFGALFLFIAFERNRTMIADIELRLSNHGRWIGAPRMNFPARQTR